MKFAAARIVMLLTCQWLLPNAFAHGEMNLRLSGQPGSPLVAYSLTGTSTATTSFSSAFIGKVFDVNDGSDPFPPQITNPSVPFGIYPLVTGGGAVVNQTTGESSSVIAVTLQDSGLFGVARFGVDCRPNLHVAAGNVFAWSGSGVIDLTISNLTFSDLTKRLSTGFAFVGGLSGTLTIVPEPATGLSLALGGAAAMAAGRRTLAGLFGRSAARY